MSYDPQGHSPQASTSNVFSTLGIVFGAIGLLIIPFLFGGVGVIMAIIAKSKKESRANIALAVSLVGLIGGMIIGAIVGAAVL